MTVEPDEVGCDCGQGIANDLGRHGLREPETIRDANRADVDAEAFVDLRAAPKRELRTPPAGVEHDQRVPGEPQRGYNRQIGEASLFLTGDHFDEHPGGLAQCTHNRIAVARDAQARGTDGRDRQAPWRFASSTIARIAADRALHSGRRDLAAIVEPLAEASDLGAIDQALPDARRSLAWRRGTSPSSYRRR